MSSSTKCRRFSHRPKLGETIGPFTIDGIIRNSHRPMYTGIDSVARRAFIKGAKEEGDPRYGVACLGHEFDVLVNVHRGSAVEHVCKVIEPGSDLKHGIPFMFLSYAGEISLDKALLYGAIGLSDPGKKITRTVEAINAKGIVHRDLKPSNIRLNGGPTIVDFGSAMYLDAPRLFYAHEAGTPGFTSPQQAEGGPPTLADEVFSVCALWCFILEGRTPYNVGSVKNEFEELEWVTFFDKPTFDRAYLMERYGEFGRILADGLSLNPAERPSVKDIGDAAEKQFREVYVPPQYMGSLPPSETPVGRGSSSSHIPRSPAHAVYTPYFAAQGGGYSRTTSRPAQPA